jgi:uncharacterized protein YyaL (SSP411 family)
LKDAVELAGVMLEHFEDPQQGGFYFTSDDHEPLIHRPKTLGDDALPAGNGIAASALARLGHLCADPQYIDAAERTLRAAWPSIMELPYAHGTLLNALEESLYPPQLVILRGRDANQLKQWYRHCSSAYAPRCMIFAIPSQTDNLSGMLAQCSGEEDIVAYICTGTTCSAPITRFDELDSHIGLTS